MGSSRYISSYFIINFCIFHFKIHQNTFPYSPCCCKLSPLSPPELPKGSSWLNLPGTTPSLAENHFPWWVVYIAGQFALHFIPENFCVEKEHVLTKQPDWPQSALFLQYLTFASLQFCNNCVRATMRLLRLVPISNILESIMRVQISTWYSFVMKFFKGW